LVGGGSDFGTGSWGDERGEGLRVKFLYANQVGADRAPHTPRRVWAGPVGFFPFLFLPFLFFFSFTSLFCNLKNIEISKMFSFKNVQI
jgi:hypothetical protein